MSTAKLTAACCLAAVFAAAAIGLALAAPASDAPTPSQVRAAAPHAPPGRIVAHPTLTAGECEGLGGKVRTQDPTCTSQSICVTVDKNGVAHQACITSDQH